MSPSSRSRLGFAILLAVVAPMCSSPVLRACLRSTLDARAVQWSSLIVEARLEAIEKPVELPINPTTSPQSATTAPTTASSDNSASSATAFQTYRFQITDVIDGDATLKDKRVQMIRLTAA